MLDEMTLISLKEKLPTRYAKPISDAYKSRYGKPISRWTIMKFLAGESYSDMLHTAVLDVVEMQQQLGVKTKEVLSA